jgi:glycine cleavage system H protein
MSDTDPDPDETATPKLEHVADDTATKKVEQVSDDEADHHGRHELAPHEPQPAIGDLQPRGFLRRGRTAFGTLAVMLCLLLGVAIATQVRQTTSGDSLDTARPADLLVLLDSLRQREATLSTEVAELQRSLNALQASGSSDQTAIQNAQARLAALSILIGTVGATGPGVTVRIDDPGPGVAPQAMLDVLDELRAAGAEAIQISDRHQAIRTGVDTWIVGAPGALTVDGKTLMPPYSVVAIGDPPTLAAAMNIPGGAVDSVKRVGGTTSVQQSDKDRNTVSEIPPDLHYTTDHEWVRRSGDDTVRVGITDFAQSALGDVVFVRLPDVGEDLTAGEAFGEVESTKSVSDLYAPVSAKVVAVNQDLDGTPELVNSEPYGGGWLLDLQVDSEALEKSFGELLDAEAYRGSLSE